MNISALSGNNIFFLLLFFVISPFTHAQENRFTNIAGFIIDQESGQPIPYANVYIANSFFGAASDSTGYYQIEKVPYGAYKLIVSHVGYYFKEQEIIVGGDIESSYKFLLMPKAYELPQLSVEAEEDDEWHDMFDIFSEHLIGKSRNSEDVVIKNPYQINFKYVDDSVLVAETDVPIIIENYALGYSISYFLKSFRYEGKTTLFSGSPVFQELEPDDPDQKEVWEENRLRAYCGSLRHFLKTICTSKKISSGNFTEQKTDNGNSIYLTCIDTLYAFKHGFKIFQTQQPLSGEMTFTNTDKFLHPGIHDSEYEFRFAGYLQVYYVREKEQVEYLEFMDVRPRLPMNQVSMIKLTSLSAPIDHKGRHFGEYKIRTYGYWAFERLADMLPIEYEVPESVLISYDASR